MGDFLREQDDSPFDRTNSLRAGALDEFMLTRYCHYLPGGCNNRIKDSVAVPEVAPLPSTVPQPSVRTGVSIQEYRGRGWA